MDDRRAAFLAFLLPSLPHLLLLCLGKVYFFGDILLQYLPWDTAAVRWIKAGYFPVWDPYTLCGYPFGGNFQSALFYPPKVLLLLVPLPLSLHLLLALHYGWAGLGTHFLVKECGGSQLGGLTAAVVFGLSGQMVAHHQHPNIVYVASWAPWVLFGLKRSIEGGTAWPAFLSTLMAVLAGHPETAFNLMPISALWALFWARGRLGSMKWAVVGVLGALFVSLAQNLFGLESFLNSCRWAMAKAGKLGGLQPLDPKLLSLILFPWLTGNYAFASYMGPSFWWEHCGFVGVVPLLAFMLGRRDFFWYAALGLLALSFVPSGKVWPFRVPSRWLIWWSLFVALHVGLNFEEKIAILRRAGKFLIGGFIALAVFMTISEVSGFGGALILKLSIVIPTEKTREALMYVASVLWALFGLWWALFGGLPIALLTLLGREKRAKICAAFVACELSIFALVANPVIGAREFKGALRNLPQHGKWGRIFVAPSVLSTIFPFLGNLSESPPVFVHKFVRACIPNVHLFGPIFSAIGYDPMKPMYTGLTRGDLAKCGVFMVVRASRSDEVTFEKVDGAVWPPFIEVVGEGGLGRPLRAKRKLLERDLLHFETLPEWRGGKVAIAVTGFPGWKGFVDGRGREVRGLRLPPRTRLLVIDVPRGRHEVWMVYHPGSFAVGLFLGLLGLAVAIGIRLFSLRR